MQQIIKEQITRLEEVVKKTASCASQALSKLIGAPVELEMSRVQVIEFGKLTAMLASPEEQVSAIILSVNGQGKGSSALVATLAESRHLAALITKRTLAAGEPLDAQAISALKETGNIIGGAFLSALSDAVGISLVQSVPELVTDTMQNVVAATVAKLPDRQKTQSISFEIDFSLRTTTTTTTTTTEIIMTHYFLIIESAFMQKLLEAMH